MTQDEKIFFAALVKDREENSKILEKASMRGIKRTVVEKYSDQAHFIYELLQNADDTGATCAEFVLHADRLIFKHTGTRKFTISDPATEDADTKNGTLGDINAITSVANSNKTAATIGKFGVGFKAVFQYTSSPAIFEDDIAFRIKDFISLEPLNFDHAERKPRETLFEFPFDRKDCPPSKAFDDISKKLLALNYPTLFLSHLQEVKFQFAGTSGHYEKELATQEKFDKCDKEISVEWLNLIQPKEANQELLLFSREINGRNYSVGFFIDDRFRLIPADKPAFCFFPTKRNTKLKFIIHAPFLLTDSREGILAGITHNAEMINLLAELAADSLIYLRDAKVIDDGVFFNKIIPVKESDFAETDEISFKPFFAAIRDKIQHEEILPTRDGYVSTENAYWADALHLLDIISDEQLGQIVHNPNAKWIFTKTNRNNADSDVKAYFGKVKSFTEDGILERIDENFIEAQPLEWFHGFYKWLSERSTKRISDAKCRPVFLDTNHKATAAFTVNGKPLIFMPTEIGNYPTICAELLQNPETENFLRETIGIKEPSRKDMIVNEILPLYKNFSVTLANESDYFKRIFEYYEQCPQSEIGNYVADLKQVIRLRNCEKNFSRPSALYMPETNFIEYFATQNPEKFLDKKFYLNLVGEGNEELLDGFFKALGVKAEIDYLKSGIIPSYKNRMTATNEEHYFKIIFRYYAECSHSYADINSLMNCVYFRTGKGNFAAPTDLYFPSPQLVEYFAAANRAPFIDKNFYLNLVGEDNEKLLDSFFEALGVAKEVRYIAVDFNEFEAEKYGLPFPEKHNWQGVIWQEFTIDGSEEIIKSITVDKSIILWRRMVAVNKVDKLAKNIRGECIYHFHTPKMLPYEPVKLKLLRETAWLVDVNGNFKKPADMTVDEMAQGYEVNLADDLEVIEFLNIAKNNRLTADERRDLDVMKRLKAAGVTEEDIDKLIADKLAPVVPPQNFDATVADNKTSGNSRTPQKLVAKKIFRPDETLPPPPETTMSAPDYTEPDADDLTPVAIDYEKKLERAKLKSDAEQAEIKQLEELQQKICSVQKYSFAWFKALLEFEIINSKEKNSGSREISISFGRVEFDAGTQRTLILKYPSRYIPQFVEELENIPLLLQTAETSKTVEIEVAGIRHNTLSVKLKETQKLDDIDLNDVVEATLTAKNPVFLLEELQKQFVALGFDDDFNLRENLCSNIEFVFGPPGTGKTYNLSQKIIRLMGEPANKKILVLTPTNKAADVIVNKIMELDKNFAYKNWLLRFGSTNDSDIEKNGVFHDKTFDIHSKPKNVTVTTIARFPYDFFITSGAGNLRDIDWDYIIIDEASMILLVQIILPLYMKKPKKFIIAGDPFQIEPVTLVDLWKNENIYTLVGLNSFTAPKTFPHDYPVETLTTQYRSVPAVGNIFSRFAYGGILEHKRAADTQRPLKIDDWLNVQTLNVIKFPVSKYESIYRSRRLGGTSSYQIYSALFTFEFVGALCGRIDKDISVGVIAPYRAQADLIAKLFAATKLNIPTGTVHTFQGDECDILIAVLNAPPNISPSPEMFLNRMNIINVAISRARDYLFLVMPDDAADKVENLRLVKYVEKLFAKEGYGEFAAQDIEKLIFGTANYIEENSFSTGHQSVNVYGRLERKYEIRSEENALDVQLHEIPFSD